MTKLQNESIGFISVLEIEHLGYCGGLLMLNALGRPIEFHCTVPASTNRAQEILYGPTLRSFLFNEKIGCSLMEKARQQPQVLVTNLSEMLQLESLIRLPVFHIVEAANDNDCGANDIANPAVASSLRIADCELAASPQSAADKSVFALLTSFAANLPLSEPFDRIQEAIMEAQSVAR